MATLFNSLFIFTATEPRETDDGRPLPLSRVVATTLLSKGRVSNVEFTNLVPGYWLLLIMDVLFPQDVGNYIYDTQT